MPSTEETDPGNAGHCNNAVITHVMLTRHLQPCQRALYCYSPMRKQTAFFKQCNPPSQPRSSSCCSPRWSWCCCYGSAHAAADQKCKQSNWKCNINSAHAAADQKCEQSKWKCAINSAHAAEDQSVHKTNGINMSESAVRGDGIVGNGCQVQRTRSCNLQYAHQKRMSVPVHKAQVWQCNYECLCTF